MTHKAQHFVPRSYLSSWCDPEAPPTHDPYVWRFSKDGNEARKKAPRNIFHSNNLYTIPRPDGSRDLTVEHGLAGMEDRFVAIRDGPLRDQEELSAEDSVLLLAFVAAMQSRTEAFLTHWQSQWTDVLSLMDDMRRDMLSRTPEERSSIARSMAPGSGPSLSRDDVAAIPEGPVGAWVVEAIQVEVPVLAEMSVAVLVTEDGLGFITSDNPCTWFDPEAYKLPPLMRGPGLGSPTIEVTLPLSPSQLLLLSRKSLTGYHDVPLGVVDELNRRTRFHCREYFVARLNQKREVWFDPGTPADVSVS